MTAKWLTVDQAAALLGVSGRAVRRRIHRGALHAERQEIPQGFRYWVAVDQPARGDEMGSTLPPGMAQIEQMIDALRSGRTMLRQALIQHQEAIDRAAFLLRQLLEHHEDGAAAGVATEEALARTPAVPAGAQGAAEEAGTEWMRRDSRADRQPQPLASTIDEVAMAERFRVLRSSARRQLRPWWLRWRRSA